MRFKCECGLRVKLVGSGCGICNTGHLIESLPTPVELAEELKISFSDDQANTIASEVYQPLLGVIEILNEKINQLAEKLDEKNIKRVKQGG